MKSSAVILAACASLAGATPTYRSGNWNSTVVNWNSTTPTYWNTSSSTTASGWSPTAVSTSTTTGLPQAEAASLPPSSSPPPPYWSNGTEAVGNETWVNHNQTRFSPGQAHQPVPLIRRFRPQRKTLSRSFLPTF